MKRLISIVLLGVMLLPYLSFSHAEADAESHDSCVYEQESVTRSLCFESMGSCTDTAEIHYSQGANVDYSGAYELLREQMVLREEVVNISVSGQHLTDSQIQELLNSALDHTGVGNEGDYIRYHLGSYSYSYDCHENDDGLYTSIVYSFTWYTDREMEEEMDKKVAEVLAELDLYTATDYEKLKGVYDYICDNVKYDYDNLEDDAYKIKYTAYAALMNKTAVCQGYASLLYRFLLELGVDCRVVTGDADGERHAWNIASVDGLYYNLDSTWDRGLSVYYRYFLCTEYNFPYHIADYKFTTSEFVSAYPMAQTPYQVVTEASGKLGNNIIWYLDTEGCLTISGSGPMTDFKNLGAPWYPYINSIKKIVIGEGITTVGSYAFVRCKIATEVVLPDSLREIHTYGFDNCRALKYITLPNSLVMIGTNAFSECVAMTSISLPDSVTTVGSSIFSNCYKLVYVKLSAGMTQIPDSMFFNMDSLTTVIIPDGIKSIGDTVFRNLHYNTFPGNINRCCRFCRLQELKKHLCFRRKYKVCQC